MVTQFACTSSGCFLLVVEALNPRLGHENNMNLAFQPTSCIFDFDTQVLPAFTTLMFVFNSKSEFKENVSGFDITLYCFKFHHKLSMAPHKLT